MAGREADILKKLNDIELGISDLEQHLDGIRGGRCDPPKGVDPMRTIATPDDIYHALSSIVGLLERLNKTVYNIGLNMVDNPEFWKQQNC